MSMKQRFPYFKFYPRDWLEATRDLTLEQRGAYIDLICIIMEMEGHLADNDKWIAHQMHVTARKWRSLKTDLVRHEKIAIRDGRIVNERCVKELDALLNQRRNIAESAVKRERIKRETPAKHQRNIVEIPEKDNENNDATTTVVPLRARVTDLDQDIDKEEAVLLGREPKTPQELDSLRDRLLGAANGAMANPASCPGLLILSEPIRWMREGCDLHLDILPTLAARGHNALPRSIKSWSYFTQAVADAKAKRERPMPAGNPGAGQASRKSWDQQRQESADEWMRQDIARRRESGRGPMQPRLDDEVPA